MQHWPLLIPKILDHAATIYPHLQILGADAGGGLERSDWSTLCGRTMHVARALEAPVLSLLFRFEQCARYLRKVLRLTSY